MILLADDKNYARKILEIYAVCICMDIITTSIINIISFPSVFGSYSQVPDGPQVITEAYGDVKLGSG